MRGGWAGWQPPAVALGLPTTPIEIEERCPQ